MGGGGWKYHLGLTEIHLHVSPVQLFRQYIDRFFFPRQAQLITRRHINAFVVPNPFRVMSLSTPRRGMLREVFPVLTMQAAVHVGAGSADVVVLLERGVSVEGRNVYFPYLIVFVVVLSLVELAVKVKIG